MDVAAALHELAVRCGIRKDVGVDGPRVHNWETGKSNPGELYVWLLCHHYDKSDAELDLCDCWHWNVDPRHARLSPAQTPVDPSLSPQSSLPVTVQDGDSSTLALQLRSADDGVVTFLVNRREFLEAMGGTAAVLATGISKPIQAPPRHPAISELIRLFFSYNFEDRTPTSLVDLDTRVNRAWQLWMTEPARYSAISSLLAPLTADVQTAINQLNTPQERSQRRRAYEIATHHYFLLRSFFRAVGRYDLATLAADRSILAAEAADDPVLMTAARWNLATVLLIDNRSDLGHEVAIEAARALAVLAKTDSQAAALVGALHLTAASAAVRNANKATIARDYIWNYAEPIARRTGETNVLWTLFGRQNVHVIAVGIEMESGNSTEVLRLADRVDVNKLPSIERRATHLLEVARSYEQRGEDTGVLHYLIRAEREGPEDLRYHPLAISLMQALLERARPTLRSDIEELAKRAGIDG